MYRDLESLSPAIGYIYLLQLEGKVYMDGMELLLNVTGRTFPFTPI